LELLRREILNGMDCNAHREKAEGSNRNVTDKVN